MTTTIKFTTSPPILEPGDKLTRKEFEQRYHGMTHLKKAELNGVEEYIVWRVQDQEIDWFKLEGGKYEKISPEQGIIKSQVFPGLNLAVDALLIGDLSAVLTEVQQGINTEVHQKFLEKLQNLRR